ncbi:hypothetical protein WN943_027158 [Citrus x changshan-huyou]
MGFWFATLLLSLSREYLAVIRIITHNLTIILCPGLISLMLVHSNTTLNCGIFGVLHFRNCQFSVRKKWSFTSLPASLNIHDLTGNNDLHQMTKGLRYAKMSSQVKGKTVSNALTTEYEENLPLSSSYENAMQALSSLITRQKRGEQSQIAGRYGKMQRMSMYLKILGLEDRIAELKVIHVSGTKGKGSTCTFCEAILRECGFRTGLFTSPHLIDVRERFRINGETPLALWCPFPAIGMVSGIVATESLYPLDITEDKFLFYFWECWHLLRENVTEDLPMPPLFQFLTVLAFKIFVCEQVDVAIIEVGLGGETDSTNVIKEPVVCGITSLGMDHMELLGNTLNDIAFHKAGIFKPQIPAFTVPQLSEAMSVLQDRALELMVPLEVAAPLDIEKLKRLELSLSGDHQLVNAGLAVSLSECWLRRTGNWEKVSHNDGQGADLPDAFVRGLSTAHLLGRAQIVYDISSVPNSSGLFENSSGELIFYLDGAHTAESMEACAKWFSSVVKGRGNSSLSSMSSTTKINNMEEVVQRNGYIGHKMEKTKQANKISKQVNTLQIERLFEEWITSCDSLKAYVNPVLLSLNVDLRGHLYWHLIWCICLVNI